jgi:hypothetical protein
MASLSCDMCGKKVEELNVIKFEIQTRSEDKKQDTKICSQCVLELTFYKVQYDVAREKMDSSFEKIRENKKQK